MSSQGYSSPRIIVSFSLLKDLTENLLPPGIQVESIVGPGLDSHGYQPTAKDFVNLKKAHLIILIGQGFEIWAGPTLKKLKVNDKAYYVTKNLPLIPLTGLEAAHHSHHHHEPTSMDPHFWHSPKLALLAIDALSLQLQASFPESAPEIKQRTIQYRESLLELRDRYKREFEQIPEAKRKMVISHNSLQYFAQEFNVTVDSPLGISQEGESSIKKISSLVKKIKSEKIQNLFLEKSSPESLMQSISKETKIPISGTLYSDCLSTNNDASTYLKMLDYNFNLILKSMKRIAL